MKILISDAFDPALPAKLEVFGEVTDDKDRLAEMDAVIIVTDHSAYDYKTIVRHASLVVDTRNATKELHNTQDNIVTA